MLFVDPSCQTSIVNIRLHFDLLSFFLIVDNFLF